MKSSQITIPELLDGPYGRQGRESKEAHSCNPSNTYCIHSCENQHVTCIEQRNSPLREALAKEATC